MILHLAPSLFSLELENAVSKNNNTEEPTHKNEDIHENIGDCEGLILIWLQFYIHADIFSWRSHSLKEGWLEVSKRLFLHQEEEYIVFQNMWDCHFMIIYSRDKADDSLSFWCNSPQGTWDPWLAGTGMWLRVGKQHPYCVCRQQHLEFLLSHRVRLTARNHITDGTWVVQGEDPVGPQPLSPLGKKEVLRGAGYNFSARDSN